MTARKLAPQPTALPKLWSVEKLAAHWATKPDTIRAWARRGQLPFLTIGRKIYFEHDALVQFLEEKRRAS